MIGTGETIFMGFRGNTKAKNGSFPVYPPGLTTQPAKEKKRLSVRGDLPRESNVRPEFLSHRPWTASGIG